ncbi:MAG TPA: hypothetical protein VD840_11935 [Sinorhizobium sp.]|nr:hypothetical protein [Sinorhizobium sp.]
MLKKNPDTFASPIWPQWPVAVDGRTLLLSLGHFQAAAIQSALRYQIETLAFMKNRTEHHMRFWEDLLASDYTRDGFDLYCGFWRDAFQDYSDEAERLTRIGSHLAAQTAKQVREDQEEMTEEVATQMVM